MSLLKSAALVLFIITAMSAASEVQTASAGDRKRVVTTVKPLNLERPPSTEEIMAAGQLGGALHPTHDQAAGNSSDAMNFSFGAAMEKWNRHEYRKASQLLKQHIKAHPDSPWVSEAALHLGCDAQYNGRYSEAKRHFERVLKDNQGKSHSGAKAMTDKANLRLGVLKAFQNNLPEAQNQFKELYKNAGDWRERTYAGHWIQRIARMKRSGKVALNCGNQALAALLERNGRPDEASLVLKTASPSNKGQSIQELEEGSVRHGLPLVARSYETGNADALTTPAIVHLPATNSGDSGHYWLFEGKDADNLKFFDPQAGKHFIQTADEFSEQWDGIALVKSDNAAGDPLGKELSETVFGGCCGVPRAEEDLGCPDGKCKNGPSMNGGTPNGSPAWTVNMVNMNFYLTDIPLWYKSPIGPAVEIQLSYNSQSAIALNEPFGNKWQFNYSSYLVVDTAGEVTVFMPDGRRDVYRPNNPLNPAAGYQKPYGGYNALTNISSNLFEMTLPEGTVYRYAIPAGTTSLQPFLVEIRDTYNQKLSFGYNLNVQLITITDATGKVTNLSYNGNGLVSQVTDPFSRHADFTYDGAGNLTGITDMGGYASSFTYDAISYLTSITNGGGTWQVFMEPADGVDNNMDKYPAPGAPMWENYRTTITNPQGGKEEYYYDGYHSAGWYKSPRHYGTDIKTITYDYMKNTTSASGGNGELRSVLTPEGVLTLFSYDFNGNIISEIDGHGDTTHYTYNSMGRVITKTRPNLQTTTVGYAAANGVDITSITDGLGSITVGYNNFRDITSITDRIGAATSITYNSFGQPVSITDSLNNITTKIYDNNNFLTQISRNGLTIKNFTYDVVGRVRTLTDATGVTLTFDYNNLDDVTRITWPDGKFVSTTYSSSFPHLITSKTDRGGRTTSMTHDSLKRLTMMSNAEGGVTKFSYDKDGRVILMSSPSGGVTRYIYNSDGQLKIKIEPDGSRTSYAYDSGGLLQALTNGRLTSASYLYDVNDNLISVSYSDGVTPTVTFQYDGFDRLTGMNDALGAHLYTYDANSRLTSINGPLLDDTITYTYDSEGRRNGESVLGGLATTLTFDAFNRLTAVSNSSGTYGYGYAGASPRVTTLSRPTGNTSYLYDTLARLTSISNKKTDTSIISSYGYTYDNVNDLRSTETIVGGTAASFVSDSQTGYNFDAANKLLTATTPVTFSYDSDGNMTGGVTPDGFPFSALYNAKNQLVSLEYVDGSAIVRKTTYGYNGFGFLEEVNKYANGNLAEQIQYVRDRSMVHQERSSLLGVSDYTWGIGYGGGIGGLQSLKRGASVYSYLYDGKGNVTSVLDSTQTEVAGYSYDPFGVLLQKTGTLEQSFRFSTKPYDEKTGLSYYGSRYYSPETGRWLTRDPLEEEGGLNLYQFAMDNSLNYIDPDGKNPIVLGLAIGVGIGLAIVYRHEIAEWWNSDSMDAKVTKRVADKTIKKACKLNVYKPADMKETEELTKAAEERGKDSVKPFSERLTKPGYDVGNALGGY